MPPDSSASIVARPATSTRTDAAPCACAANAPRWARSARWRSLADSPPGASSIASAPPRLKPTKSRFQPTRFRPLPYLRPAMTKTTRPTRHRCSTAATTAPAKKTNRLATKPRPPMPLTMQLAMPKVPRPPKVEALGAMPHQAPHRPRRSPRPPRRPHHQVTHSSMPPPMATPARLLTKLPRRRRLRRRHHPRRCPLLPQQQRPHPHPSLR